MRALLKKLLRFLRLGPEPTLSFSERFAYWCRITRLPPNARIRVSQREFARLMWEMDTMERLVIQSENGVLFNGYTVEPDPSLNDGIFASA